MPRRSSSHLSRSLSQSSRSRSGPSYDRDSMRSPSTPGRSSNPNVFSDEYSLEPIDSEQATLTPRSPSISSIASSNTLRSSLPHHQKQFAPVPNDDEPFENPFGDNARVSLDEETLHRSSLPQKGVDLSYRHSITSNTTSPSLAQRSQSSSSRFSIPPRALSPYTGATGPSHPYAMYPQVGVSRSPSVTTTSTIRPVDRPLEDSNAPQHPYAMYSQNVVLEEGIDNSAIPLGFPGHSQEAYQRPLGRADDDVGDLVGPDGHTEQLPPYSRYPDGASPKLEPSLNAVPNGTNATDTPSGNDNRDLPMSEVSSRTLIPANPTDERTGGEPNPPPITGVMAFEEKLKSKGKKKACCGLPIWTLVLITVVIIVGGSIGGAIGGVLGTKKAADQEAAEEDPPKIVTVTETPRTDATPISTIPSNLVPLPTGQFVIPAESKNQSKFCILDQDYTPSWGCLKSKSLPIRIGGNETNRRIDFESDPFSKTLTYGAQPPFFSNPSLPLSYVVDGSDLSLGPALSFFTFFDKLIIVPEDTFSSEAASKRSISEQEIFANVHHRKRSTDVGDRPWFCWWNSTVMEFFVYINEYTKEARYASVSTTAFQDASPTEVPSELVTDDRSATESLTKRGDTRKNYPRRIKMEERRDYAEAQAPYCQQMQIMDDGSLESVSHETIGISVNEPTPTTTLRGLGSMTQTYTAKAQYQSVCYCVSLTD